MGRVKAEARREYVFREGNVQQIQRAYRQHLSRLTLQVSKLDSDRISTVYVKIYYIMSYYTLLHSTIYYAILYCTIQILSLCVVQFNTSQYNTLQTLIQIISFELSRHFIPIVGKSCQLFIENGHFDLQFHPSKSWFDQTVSLIITYIVLTQWNKVLYVVNIGTASRSFSRSKI